MAGRFGGTERQPPRPARQSRRFLAGPREDPTFPPAIPGPVCGTDIPPDEACRDRTPNGAFQSAKALSIRALTFFHDSLAPEEDVAGVEASGRGLAQAAVGVVHGGVA